MDNLRPFEDIDEAVLTLLNFLKTADIVRIVEWLLQPADRADKPSARNIKIVILLRFFILESTSRLMLLEEP